MSDYTQNFNDAYARQQQENLKRNTQGRTQNMGQGPQGSYAGGLPTDFNSRYSSDPNNVYRDYSSSSDSDVRQAQRLTNENASAAAGLNDGVDSQANQAMIDMYKGRIGMKNTLAQQIASSPQQLQMQKDQVTGATNRALDQGTRNTRQNFNSRGLLYSGMREGGEQAVRGAVAGQYGRGMAGAERDNANSVSAAQNAYAAVDLANQKDAMDKANAAFDTASANNIARLQAMQQLGAGVGQSAGMIAGSYGRTPSQNPMSGFQPMSSQMQMPQMGSQYSHTGGGLLGDQ